ncbi:MAG: DNA alkylation repair protein [Bacillota bacterium]|nr:DNA alkylation repair protein [Bacillota bacterium]
MFRLEKWEPQDHEALTKYLVSLADEKYKNFQGRLLPGLEEPLLGVALPHLRKLAKEITNGNALSFLDSPRRDCYEEIMLEGLVIGALKEDYPVVMKYVRGFVPKINNWAVCDSFAAGLKIVKTHRSEFYAFLSEYLHSSREFYVRFAIVSLMDHFMETEYIDRVLEDLNSVHHRGYYAKMAVAWAVSAAYVKFKDNTMTYLEDCSLDPWTYNKALQKIRESNRVDKEEKEIIKAMKRR